MKILEKYRLNFKVDDEVDANTLERNKNVIRDFQLYLKKVLPVMEVLPPPTYHLPP